MTPLRRQYAVTVEAAGFRKETRRDIEVLVNTNTRVDLQLQPGAVRESIEVTGAPPLFQIHIPPSKPSRPWTFR